MNRESQKQFEKDGYFVFKGMLSSRELEALRARVEDDIRIRSEPILYEDVDSAECVNVPELYRQGGRIFRRLNAMIERGGIYRELLEGPIRERVLSVLAAPVQVCLNRHNMLMLKAPYNPAPVPWHQDAGVWNEGTFRHKAFILALDDFHDDNGALEVVPGSHRLDPVALPYGEHVQEVESRYGSFIQKNRVRTSLKAGDGILFDGLLLHGSEGNRSGAVRRTLTYAFFPGDLTAASNKIFQKGAVASAQKPVVFSL